MAYQRVYLLFLLTMMSIVCQRLQATPAELLLPDRRGVAGLLAAEEELYGPLAPQDGEVLAAGREYLVIRREDGKESEYRLPKGCLVYVNGRPGESAALGPVAEGCYFQVRLYFLAGGDLRLVEGWYLGCEVIVLSVEDGKEGKSFITVRGLESRKEIMLWRPAGREAKLSPGTTGYLLFAPDGRIRKFFPVE